MSDVAIDLTKTVKEIITTMKTAIDNLNTNVDSLKSEVLLAAHPVGSYYISDNATDPGTLFGGTWQMLDPGLTLISQGKGTDKFGSFEFVAGQTYGERMHQLTVEELPNRTPIGLMTTAQDGASPTSGAPSSGLYQGRVVISPDNVVKYGKGLSHNNEPPAKAVYIWTRIS